MLLFLLLIDCGVRLSLLFALFRLIILCCIFLLKLDLLLSFLRVADKIIWLLEHLKQFFNFIGRFNMIMQYGMLLFWLLHVLLPWSLRMLLSLFIIKLKYRKWTEFTSCSIVYVISHLIQSMLQSVQSLLLLMFCAIELVSRRHPLKQLHFWSVLVYFLLVLRYSKDGCGWCVYLSLSSWDNHKLIKVIVRLSLLNCYVPHDEGLSNALWVEKTRQNWNGSTLHLYLLYI